MCGDLCPGDERCNDLVLVNLTPGDRAMLNVAAGSHWYLGYDSAED